MNGPRSSREMDAIVILVLDASSRRRWTRALNEMGFVSEAQTTMHGVLNRVRHRRVVAIVAGSTHNPDIDLLELVFNVRDLDETVPILVAGATSETVRSYLSDRSGITFLPRGVRPESLGHLLRCV